MARILLTGGAGFIGSNLLKSLINRTDVKLVRVYDDFSTGFRQNVEPFIDHPSFELVEADIRDYDTLKKAMQGITHISHQAALGSVPRSIENPLRTNSINIDGTLNVFYAAVEMNISRVVFAASSSTYGDHEGLPKQENHIGKPLSPYAVTKYVNELYADVFSRSYDFEYIGLRYFNVFGPHQSPTGAYAAVIPLFMQAFYDDTTPMINGDGTISRDFTYIENVVQANEKALFTDNTEAVNQIYNVAKGGSTSLNDLVQYLREATGKEIQAQHRDKRMGDIEHSLADVSKAQKLLAYDPLIDVREGLARTWAWFSENQGYFDS